MFSILLRSLSGELSQFFIQLYRCVLVLFPERNNNTLHTIICIIRFTFISQFWKLCYPRLFYSLNNSSNVLCSYIIINTRHNLSSIIEILPCHVSYELRSCSSFEIKKLTGRQLSCATSIYLILCNFCEKKTLCMAPIVFMFYFTFSIRQHYFSTCQFSSLCTCVLCVIRSHTQRFYEYYQINM